MLEDREFSESVPIYFFLINNTTTTKSGQVKIKILVNFQYGISYQIINSLLDGFNSIQVLMDFTFSNLDIVFFFILVSLLQY